MFLKKYINLKLYIFKNVSFSKVWRGHFRWRPRSERRLPPPAPLHRPWLQRSGWRRPHPFGQKMRWAETRQRPRLPHRPRRGRQETGRGLHRAAIPLCEYYEDHSTDWLIRNHLGDWLIKNLVVAWLIRNHLVSWLFRNHSKDWLFRNHSIGRLFRKTFNRLTV